MFLWIKSLRIWVLGASVGLLFSCTQKQSAVQKSFYNFDSLVTAQAGKLKGFELTKSVLIDTAGEQAQLIPDSTQWTNELELFRQLAEVNKASFRDAYVVNDLRDTNSNLTVREIKAQRDVPVSLVRLYYLHTPDDLRKVEATFVEENALYINTRKMMMELVRFNDTNLIHRYRVESVQKFMVSDSVRFVIAGEVAM